MGIPSGRYLKTIQTGYKEAGFDENVLMEGGEKSMDRMKQEWKERMEVEPATAALIAKGSQQRPMCGHGLPCTGSPVPSGHPCRHVLLSHCFRWSRS